VLRARLGELVASARERTLTLGKHVLLCRFAFRLALTQLVKLLPERCRVLLRLVAQFFGVARCLLRVFRLSLGLVHRFLR
jgi:TRAP-type C4-dicarboxylate transport system permease small subunit